MDKLKNTITNILGLIFWGFSVWEMTQDASLTHITTYIILGAILFRYKWSETKKVIDAYIKKKLE